MESEAPAPAPLPPLPPPPPPPGWSWLRVVPLLMALIGVGSIVLMVGLAPHLGHCTEALLIPIFLLGAPFWFLALVFSLVALFKRRAVLLNAAVFVLTLLSPALFWCV